MHEATGDYYVVDGGVTAIGPFGGDEILRHWRVASAASEPVLGTPNYFDHYQPAPLPFAATEWRDVDPDTLPPSVTHHRGAQGELVIEWVSPSTELRDEILALVNAREEWIGAREAIFGRVGKGTPCWGHPSGSVLVCRRPEPGERAAVVEWPARRSPFGR